MVSMVTRASGSVMPFPPPGRRGLRCFIDHDIEPAADRLRPRTGPAPRVETSSSVAKRYTAAERLGPTLSSLLGARLGRPDWLRRRLGR